MTRHFNLRRSGCDPVAENEEYDMVELHGAWLSVMAYCQAVIALHLQQVLWAQLVGGLVSHSGGRALHSDTCCIPCRASACH